LSEDWVIAAVSANIGDYVDCDPAALIGRSASELLAEDAVHALRNRLALLRDPEGVERLLACRLTRDDHSFDVAIHLSGGLIVIEAEPATSRTYGDMTATLRGMFARVDRARGLPDFLGEAARQMRALTGFEHVVILRFNRDWSSEVVAEHARAGIASLLGEQIAADQVPLEERLSLQRSPLHLSGDCEAEPVPLLLGGESKCPDLARAILRPITPAYRDQLRNMGARASMSLALIIGGSLWGIIACLHHQPRSPGFERRSIADMFAQLLGLRIEVRELKAAAATAD